MRNRLFRRGGSVEVDRIARASGRRRCVAAGYPPVSGLSSGEIPTHNAAMQDTGRLVVVDEDPNVGAMLVEYLSGHRFEVQAVDSGSAMRAEIERNLPDLILLDIRLPG